MIFPSVDLPAPFSPTSAWIEPGAIREVDVESAWTPPKRFETPRSSAYGSVPVALTRRTTWSSETWVREHGRPDWKTPVTGARLGEAGEIAGIAVEHDRVEDVALVDRPELGVDAAQLSAASGRREQRLLDGQIPLGA